MPFLEEQGNKGPNMRKTRQPKNMENRKYFFFFFLGGGGLLELYLQGSKRTVTTLPLGGPHWYS